MKRKLFAVFLISMTLISSAIYAIFEVMESAMSANEQIISLGGIFSALMVLGFILDSYYNGVIKK